jgi:hypothetical protein
VGTAADLAIVLNRQFNSAIVGNSSTRGTVFRRHLIALANPFIVPAARVDIMLDSVSHEHLQAGV